MEPHRMPIRKLIVLLLLVAAAAISAINAVNSDAWKVGQTGAAIGESALPLIIAAVAAVFIWPRKPKTPLS
jgi:S1-C subfamily serine protease